jgi:hypothetical protein
MLFSHYSLRISHTQLRIPDSLRIGERMHIQLPAAAADIGTRIPPSVL